jgi:hypothetical protein
LGTARGMLKALRDSLDSLTYINTPKESRFLCTARNTLYIITNISGSGSYQKLLEVTQKCFECTLVDLEMKTIKKIVHVCS